MTNQSIVEKMYESVLIANELIHSHMQKNDLDDVAAAFWNVWDNRKELDGNLFSRRRKNIFTRITRG